MGAWGYGIRDDDFVMDVIGAFEDLLKAGRTVADATRAVTSQFAAASADQDDGPLFWVAVAEVQWTCGELDPQVRARVENDLASGRSLRAWAEEPAGLARRRNVLDRFIARIAAPNPRPKKPSTVMRAPKFQPGECLSIRLSNGQYGAALVLAADHAHAEYGRNLVGVLDYLSPEKPTLEVFRARKWLIGPGPDREPSIAWHYPMGFRAVKPRLEVVARVDILDSDPKDSRTSCRWTGIGEQVLRNHNPGA